MKGKAVFKGTPPKLRVISMDPDPACPAKHPPYVSKGIEGKTFPAPAAPVVPDQDGRMRKMRRSESLNISITLPWRRTVESSVRPGDRFSTSSGGYQFAISFATDHYRLPERRFEVQCFAWARSRSVGIERFRWCTEPVEVRDVKFTIYALN